MIDNDLQQSLRELRSHRKLPEREGEYWSDEEREDLSRNLLPLEPPKNLQSLVFQALTGFY